ncbi:MAG: IclR family transcriptional regulator [Burkholderiales bacterium]
MNAATLQDADAAMKSPVSKAIALLRMMAVHGRRGAALTELAAEARMPHPTVHRLLHQLLEERLVVRDDDTRRYRLGSLTFELGVAAAQLFDIRAYCRPALERLAMECGDTAYLVLRSNAEAVCLDLVQGPAPIRVVNLEIGSRRLLGVGAGGLAIVAALREADRNQLLTTLYPRLVQEFKLPVALVSQSVADTRKAGFSLIRNRITLGTTAVGRHICDSLGNPIAAVSIAAINDRMDPRRIAEVARHVQRTAQEMEETLRGQRSAHT